MSKIPIRIYRLNSNNISQEDIQNLSYKPSNYLINITDSDIYSSSLVKTKLVNVGVENIPASGTIALVNPGDVKAVCSVYENQDKYSILVKCYDVYGNSSVNTFYIKKSNELEDTKSVTQIFEFYVNPNHITPSYRKLVTEVRTRGGWEIQHWGEALTEVRVQGKSGGLNRVGTSFKLKPDQTIMDSTAWQRLQELRSIYEEDHKLVNQVPSKLLGFNYLDRFYIGYFTEFTGPEADADIPYLVTYSFVFKVQSERKISSSKTVLQGSKGAV